MPDIRALVSLERVVWGGVSGPGRGGLGGWQAFTSAVPPPGVAPSLVLAHVAWEEQCPLWRPASRLAPAPSSGVDAARVPGGTPGPPEGSPSTPTGRPQPPEEALGPRGGRGRERARAAQEGLCLLHLPLLPRSRPLPQPRHPRGLSADRVPIWPWGQGQLPLLLKSGADGVGRAGVPGQWGLEWDRAHLPP